MLRILWVYWNAFIYILLHFFPIRRRYRHPKRYDIQERFKHIGRLCNIIVKRTGLDVMVLGREHLLDTPVLYISNHPSMIDPYFVSYAVQRQLAATIAGDLWFQKIPVLAPWFQSFGCVFIDRKNPREGIKGINQAIENVEKGHSLLLFPEGEITHIITKEPVAEFQSGGLRIAVKAKVPIIPIVIIGSEKIYTAHEVIGRLKKGKLTIKILPPYTKHFEKDLSQQEMADELRDIYLEELKDYEIPS